MATRRALGILSGEMVVGAYIERHLLFCCLRARRYAIERLGIGWLYLAFLPIHCPLQVTLPSHPGIALRATRARVLRQSPQGGW